MMDLAALTAKTGDEFAMFTLGAKRLVVRGDAKHVNIDTEKAAKMNAQGYKWSGHTHISGLVASEGDKAVLRAFNQNKSAVYNAVGEFREFFKG
jgi:hypothetical protein